MFNLDSNKIKGTKQTIETVLENENENNYSCNQNTDDRRIENDPIVTFLFYNENKIENLNLIEKNNNSIIIPDKSLVLKPFDKNKSNNVNFNINDYIDDISQSQIFPILNNKVEKSYSLENFNLNKDFFNEIKDKENHNENNSFNNEKFLLNDRKKNDGENINYNHYKNNKIKENKKNCDNNKNKNIEINTEFEQQSEKLNILFSEIVEACPIIQLSADTTKVIIIYKF